MTDTINILDGSTFVVSDDRGDMAGSPVEPHGFFRNDTRYLSRWLLSLDGERPSTLSVDNTKYYAAQFFLAPGTSSAYINAQLAVIRKRTVLDGFHETISLVNHHSQQVTVEVKLEVDADFADLFEVKDAIGQKMGEPYRRVEEDHLVLGYRREAYCRETWIRASGDAVYDLEGLAFTVTLQPQEAWTTEIDVLPVDEPDDSPRFPRPWHWEDPETRLGLRVMRGAVPMLSCDWVALQRIYERSLADLAALRFDLRARPGHFLPAAGLPWFMAAFGRDSLITSLQALPFQPELAQTTLETLAALQAVTRDEFRDAEPGKILHELRFGELTAFEERPHSPYYGAADSTQLWLVLLDEYERWTGRSDVVRALEPAARAATRWIDQYGDRDGDGYVEYERRNPETGLENQCWKDSWDSIQWADGTLASLPRATCELQGYVYDAKVRCARLAREVWDDPAWAEQLLQEAAELKDRFNRDFWLPEKGYYAVALDGEKKPVDSLTSNIGHLLWSGIVADEHVPRVVECLMSERLFTGWGIRTFATEQTGYNPIGYHVGTVWPHDTAIAVMGLRRYGYTEEAARIAMGLLEAAELMGGRLPEAFAGFDRELTAFPAEYPTACSPQAWASGAPLMLIRALLGLEVSGSILRSNPHLPYEIRRLQLTGVPGRWGSADVGVDLTGEVLRVGVPDTDITRLVARTVEKLDPRLARGHRVAIGFEIQGASPIRVVLEEGKAMLDSHAEPADCTVRTDEATLLGILRGQRNWTTAMMSDRLHLHGDRLLALAFFTRSAELAAADRERVPEPRRETVPAPTAATAPGEPAGAAGPAGPTATADAEQAVATRTE
jgi:glycogen debranching enzyme/putative sterol carrier protein